MFNEYKGVTKKLAELYALIEYSSDIEIENGYYGLAITQCITNLYEAANRIDNEIIITKLIPVIQKTKITIQIRIILFFVIPEINLLFT